MMIRLDLIALWSSHRRLSKAAGSREGASDDRHCASLLPKEFLAASLLAAAGCQLAAPRRIT